MVSLILTLVLLVGVYLLQQGHPVVAGLIAVAPIKIVATSFIAFEDGGVARLHDVISGMLIGQVAWGVILLAIWIALK